MKSSEVLFWNVDTQFDFVEQAGKLYVPGAELIKPVWKQITKLAAELDIPVVNTADWHYADSAELSSDPDFVSTFPEHCMADTSGADYVGETKPEDSVVFDWNKEYPTLDDVWSSRNIVIRKDAFDVFVGNPFAEKIVRMLAPKTVIVYGVTTNVCVHCAVVGLAERVERVVVVEDAIKELPNIPLPFQSWKELGVQFTKFKDLKNHI